MDTDRVAQLEKLGMVWSHYDVAWEEGLAAARGWATENGHLLAPLDATHQGYRVGIWLKNARAAARKATAIEHRRAQGLPVQSSAGALPDERREKLEDIDPSWYPAWPVEWQRAFHLVRQHLEAGGLLPMEPGTVVHQGEDLGRWVHSVWLGCDKLTTMQQWTCEQVLGIEPATEYEGPPPPRTQADKWAMNYAAAKQFYERKGHLRLPRKHVETIVVGVDGGDQEERELKLGTWIGNHRSRATTLTPERAEQLSTIGMRWNQNSERHMSLAPPHNLGGGAVTDGLQGDRLPKPTRGPDQAVRASGMFAPSRPDLCDAGHRPPAAATTAAPRL